MEEGSLCLLVKDDKVLMMMPNRGVSKGKWNFPGGHLEPSETIEECVVREVAEETGLHIEKAAKVGRLTFTNPDWIVNVFHCTDFSGNIRESSEGGLIWMKIKEIPYEKMWEADKFWVPLAIKKKSITGSFHYDKDNKTLVKYELKESKPERQKH
jgi:8-oxo-dGTP diphosphatase